MSLEAIRLGLAHLKPDAFNKFCWALGLATLAAFVATSPAAARAGVAAWVERHAGWIRGLLIAAAAGVAAVAAYGACRAPLTSVPALAVTGLGVACVAVLAGFGRWAARAPIRDASLVLGLLALAALARFGGTALSRDADRHIDLTIYVSGGRLLSAGVNPYDWSDRTAARERLRFQPGSYEPWVSETQERWNHYASSNLPLTLMCFGLADRFGSQAIAYRVMFAIFDCALSAMIGLFVLRHWFGGEAYRSALKIGVLLGALSPVLLSWGTRQPEDKGLEILLMLAALHFARAPRSRMAFAAFLLASSVAFKAIGLLVAPLAAFWMWQARGDRSVGERSRRATVFAGLTAIAGLALFGPFLPEVVGKAEDRLVTHVGAALPIHGSPFALIATLWPGGWGLAHRAVLAALAVMLLLGGLTRRLALEVVTAGALVLFVVVVLLTGSLDRMNMAFLTAVLLVGTVAPRGAGGLAALSFLAYLPVVVIGISSERYDQAYALLVLAAFLVTFFILLVRGVRPGAAAEPVAA